jgi:predicted dienelactone hydrolase
MSNDLPDLAHARTRALRQPERIGAGSAAIARVAALLLYALAGFACDDPTGLETRDDALREREHEPERPGYAVGTVRIQVPVSEGRTLPVQVWYPAVERARRESERGRPLLEIEPETREHNLLEQLLAAAPEPGATHVMHAADAPAPLRQAAPFPLIVFSHCADCVRYSTLTVAEHLASLGFVVAAPDHLRNTVYDLLEGNSIGLDLPGFLPQRVADMTAVLNTMLDRNARALPNGLRGRIDAERVGAYGHSFGGLTTGLVVEQDARVRAGVAIAIHIAIPAGAEAQYPPGVRLADLSRMTKPFMFLVASEDLPLFNASVDDNFHRYLGQAWRVTVRDTGHYSFTDICGMPAPTAPGSCSPAPRQTDPNTTFEPLESERSRELAKQYVAAFFERALLGRGRGPRGVPDLGDAVVEYNKR